MLWTKKSLKDLIKDKLKDHPFIVASNREPYIHNYDGNKITCIRPPSGVVTALDPILQACDGVWVAHGAGDADRKVVDKNDRVRVPSTSSRPNYTLKRVWMTKDEEIGYYYGFANETLWPLCHVCYTKPKFHQGDWGHYKNINQRFADAILEEAGGKEAFIFIQDYHLALVPKMIKEANPKVKITHFWHIPWPNPEVFRLCPWKKELLEGLLGADLLGFHIDPHVDNFLETVEQTLPARVNKNGKKTLVRSFPISIDFEQIAAEASAKSIDAEIKQLKEKFGIGSEIIAVSTDRIDYTKGLLEKLIGIERFLEKYPEYQGRFVFIQFGSLSRIHLDVYKKLNDELNSLVERINWKFASDNWKPIILVRKYFSNQEIYALYRMANLCLVSSLHDGMNLVSKEYIAAAPDDRGMLTLSRFTGAARELTEAITFNPFDPEELADAIKQTISLPENERRSRMDKLKALVRENNIYAWSAKIIQSLLRLA